jgi:hypothetical protein
MARNLGQYGGSPFELPPVDQYQPGSILAQAIANFPQQWMQMKLQADKMEMLGEQKDRQMELDEFKAGAAAMGPIADEDPEAYYRYLQSNAEKYPFLGLDTTAASYSESVLEPHRARKDAMHTYLSGAYNTREDLQLIINDLEGTKKGRDFIRSFGLLPKMEEFKQFESSKSSWDMLFNEAKTAGMITDEQLTSAKGMLASSGTAAQMSQLGANILNIGKWEVAEKKGDIAEAQRLVQDQIDIHTKLAKAIEGQVLYPRYFAEAKLRLGLSGVPDNDLNDTQTQRVSDIANQIQTERYNYHTSEALELGVAKLGISITPHGGGIVSGKFKESDKFSGTDYTVKEVYDKAFKLYPDLFKVNPDGIRTWDISKIKDKKHKEKLLLKVIEGMDKSKPKKSKLGSSSTSSVIEYPVKTEYERKISAGKEKKISAGKEKKGDVPDFYLTKEKGYRVIQDASEALWTEKVFSILGADGKSIMLAYNPLRSVE